jgi:hypothetical protein
MALEAQQPQGIRLCLESVRSARPHDKDASPSDTVGMGRELERDRSVAGQGQGQ